MQDLIRYKIGYEISWAVFRCVQGRSIDLSKETVIPVEIVPNWTVEVLVNPLLTEDVVRMGDGRKAFLLRPNHRKVTLLADSLLVIEEEKHYVRDWIGGLSVTELADLKEGFLFYLQNA